MPRRTPCVPLRRASAVAVAAWPRREWPNSAAAAAAASNRAAGWWRGGVRRRRRSLADSSACACACPAPLWATTEPSRQHGPTTPPSSCGPLSPEGSGVLEARASCARLSNTTKGIRCEPFGLTPPCIGGDGKFFDVSLDSVPLAPPQARVPLQAHVRTHGRRSGYSHLAQCRARKRDEDWWMAYDPYAKASRSHTRSVADVDSILGERIVALIGASDTSHTKRAIECHLARHDLWESKRCNWVHWGWAQLDEDNCGCSSGGWDRFVRCAADLKGGSLDVMLQTVDVVVVAYNPQHYSPVGHRHLRSWQKMLSILVPRLQEFASTPGKAAFLREPGAQHFSLGSYQPGDETRLASCLPLSPEGVSTNYDYLAGVAMHEAVAKLRYPRYVSVLPFFNESARRYNMHMGSCVARRRRKEVESDDAAESSEKCVTDCLHWCYTPQFFDDSLFTPLYNGLVRADRAWPRSLLDRIVLGRHKARANSQALNTANGSCADQMPACFGMGGLAVYWHNRRVAEGLMRGRGRNASRRNQSQMFVGEHEGTCGVTESTGDCRNGKLGFSSEPRNMQQCVAFCRSCAGCNYVSFSKKNEDCSWFAECPRLAADDLLQGLPGQAVDYLTTRVREEGGRRTAGGEEEEEDESSPERSPTPRLTSPLRIL